MKAKIKANRSPHSISSTPCGFSQPEVHAANLPNLGSIKSGVNGSGPPVKNSVLPPPKSRSTVESQRIVVTKRYGDLTLSTCLNSL